MTILHTHPHQCVPHLHTFAHTAHPVSLPILPEPAPQPTQLTSSHPDRLSSVSPPSRSAPPTTVEGGAPPAACTAPWRPPAQPESLGSPPPAGPPGSAEPAAAVPPHLPMGPGEKFQGQELSRQACLSLRHLSPLPALPEVPLAGLATLLQALPATGARDPTWPAVPSTSHWASSCNY